ncbi:MAG: hypothetical protein JWR89_5196 [Tardiphaga sp.]|uniref:hypothetical protein n=1 Tax=Tardiphaga sp. TaxID=1926292 RepID=UPI00260BA2EA|nr:hypothetical protein [Tardiphaga sp.]MDB5505294.1 hypothetical protein [Tardiphaga sp.]
MLFRYRKRNGDPAGFRHVDAEYVMKQESALFLFRYLCLVGSVLVGALWLFGSHENGLSSAQTERWTSLDTLRAMAHHGEPQRRQAVFTDDAAPVRLAVTEAAPLPPAPPLVSSAIKSPAINISFNDAQARYRLKETARSNMSRKPRRQAIAARAVKPRTAGATTVATADRMSPIDFFGSAW